MTVSFGTVAAAKARSSGYGFLGGIGIGNRDWSVGAFAGYLDSRQRITALGAATSTDVSDAPRAKRQATTAHGASR